jgi:hypothetical protein
MTRRIAWVAAMLIAAWTPHALAQDARTSAVQDAARDWVAFVDKGDYQASWRAAGTKFQANITADRWAEAAKRVRVPLGEVKRRSAARTTFRRSFPGVSEGDYALVLFRTSFAKKEEATETVTLEHEPDGKWRVIGYFIR